MLLASGSVAPYGSADTAGKERVRVAAELVNGSAANAGDYVLNYDVDCTDMIGEYVKVLYNTKEKVVYGVYTNDEETTVVIDTTVGALSDVGVNGALTYDSVSYDIASGAQAYVVTSDTAWTPVALGSVAGNSNVANYDNIKLVDNDGDGALDVAFVVANNIAEVTYVGTDSITLAGFGSLKNTDGIYSDLAVGDFVAWNNKNTNFAGKYVVTEADTLSGKVTEVGYKTGTLVNRILVDGTWYNLGLNDMSTTAYVQDKTPAPLNYGNTYDMALYNGYVVDADKVVGGNAKLAVLTGVTTNQDFDGNYQVRLLLANGETVEGFADIEAVSTTGILTPDTKVGALVSYTMEDGIYVCKDVSGSEKAGYDNWTTGTGYDKTNGYISGPNKKINNSAVVFVMYDSDLTTANMQPAFRVTTGSELNSWKSNYGSSAEILWNNAGLNYADVVYIVGAAQVPTPGTVSNYGYITSAITAGNDDSGDYSAFTMWDGSNTISVITRSSLNGASKGDVISFDWDGATEIKNITKITATHTAALMYTNGEQVRLNGTGYDLADDVTIINVNTKDVEGVGGSAITTAAQSSTPNVYYYNCWYQISDGEVSLLVIDVTNGYLNGAAYMNGWNDSSDMVVIPPTP